MFPAGWPTLFFVIKTLLSVFYSFIRRTALNFALLLLGFISSSSSDAVTGFFVTFSANGVL